MTGMTNTDEEKEEVGDFGSETRSGRGGKCLLSE